MRQPLSVTQEPPFFPQASLSFLRSLLLYIILFCSSSSYTCQSSMPILECMSHQPLFLALCELLWPPLHCPRVTSTLMVSGCQLQVFNTEVTASPGFASPKVASPLCSYGQPIGLRISLAILKGIASGDVAPSSPMILACRGQSRPQQYILAVWIPFIRPRALLSPRRGPWA